MRRVLALLAVLLAAAGVVSITAVELSVMSAGALESGVGPVVTQFERVTGHKVAVEYGTAPQLAARLSRGQQADVLIAPVTVMDQAVNDGLATPSTRMTVGRIGVGVLVRTGAAAPDVSSEALLRRALLSADAVVYNEGSSGQYIDALFDKLGIATSLESRILRLADADDVVRRIATGSGRDLGFGALTAIKRSETMGISLVAPLPDALQNFTVYDAAIRSGAPEPQAAAALLQFLKTPAARHTLTESGVSPR